MRAAGLKRLIFISSMGIYGEVPGERYRSVLDPYRDSAAVIEASDLDYTILRPGWFTHDATIAYRITQKGEPFRAQRGEVTGRVRLTVPSAAVSLVLARLLPRFIERYAKVEVDVRVDDSFVNIVSHGFDAGIRLIEAIDRDMVHVRLLPACRIVVVGAPSYLDRRGIPQKPADLLQHDCVGIRFESGEEPFAWELERGKKTWRVPVRGSVTTNNFELMRLLAVAGVGLFYALEPTIADELSRGRLRVVLEQYAPAVPGLFLYFPSRAQVSPALKAFVDVARQVMNESKPAK
jgi:DNA-binding transcriptional LysR family regulator